MKILILNILLALSMTVSAASDNKSLQKQFKKDISNIKQNLKKNKDLEKSETTLRKYLSQPPYNEDKEVHYLLTESLRKQYEVHNEKMYLKQKVDTATVVRSNLKLFLAIETLDSLDALPDSKGRVEPSYRKKHAEYLKPQCNNIFKGGIYFYAHNNWKEAWQCLDTYLECPKQPLFSECKLDTIEKDFASFLAVMSACNMSDYGKAMKYADDAINYTSRQETTLERLCELSVANNDSTTYHSLLKKGNEAYPLSGYFFPNLVDYYIDAKDYATALECSEKAIAIDSLNTTFLLAKHNTLMLMQQEDKALEAGINLLAIDKDNMIANYNVGAIYYKHGMAAMNTANKPLRARMEEAQKFFKQCLPYMEHYRELKPTDVAQWRPILYEVYLSLNMGKEFDALPEE